MASTDPSVIFPSIPEVENGGWIAPGYSEIIRTIQDGQSPYLVILRVLERVYFPSLSKVFLIQLWILVGLFSFAILAILTATGLRYSQGRINFFVRLDRTVVLPSSLLFPLCALVHATLGIALVAGAHQIYHLRPYPIWFIGLKAAWIGPLWTGIFFEVWACFAAWYIRRYGPQYRESLWRSSVAFAIPLVLFLGAWIPPVYFFTTASRSFRISIKWAHFIRDRLDEWQRNWTPRKGIEIAKLTQLFEPGGELGTALKRYSERSACGSRYVTIVLVATLMVYLTGAYIELAHLTRTIQRLQEANSVALVPSCSRRSSFSAVAPMTPEPGFQSLEEKLNEELARGKGKGVRQWRLMDWTRKNRILTTVCISVMLVQNAAFQLWKGVTPLTIQTPSAQFQVDILTSAWMNSILSTIVAILILFRSLDGSSPLVTRLKLSFPLLPLPPSLEAATPTLPRKRIASLHVPSTPLGRTTPSQVDFDGTDRGRPPLPRDRLYSNSTVRTSAESSTSKFGIAS